MDPMLHIPIAIWNGELEALYLDPFVINYLYILECSKSLRPFSCLLRPFSCLLT